MARTADVVVIGGGIHGCSTALHLALRGLKPVLIEKDYAGRHASGVNAGGVRQLARDHAEIPLSVSSMELWERLPDLVGDDWASRATAPCWWPRVRTSSPASGRASTTFGSKASPTRS